MLYYEILIKSLKHADVTFWFSGPVHHEKCNCPVPVGKWLKRASCPKSYTQIKLDLSLFKDIDMLKVEKEMVSRFNRPGSQSLCHYVIKNNKVSVVYSFLKYVLDLWVWQ